MTIRQEIEQAIRAGAHPLFLYGLIHMVERGYGKRLTAVIDEIGQKVYLENENALDKTELEMDGGLSTHPLDGLRG